MALKQTISLQKTEIVLVIEGLNYLVKMAQQSGDDFKASYISDVRDHFMNVVKKLDARANG